MEDREREKFFISLKDIPSEKERAGDLNVSTEN
jgi:hypothetical protein